MCFSSPSGSINAKGLRKYLQLDLLILVHHFLGYSAKGLIERLYQSISYRTVLRGMVSFDQIISVQFIQSRALERLTVISRDGF